MDLNKELIWSDMSEQEQSAYLRGVYAGLGWDS